MNSHLIQDILIIAFVCRCCHAFSPFVLKHPFHPTTTSSSLPYASESSNLETPKKKQLWFQKTVTATGVVSGHREAKEMLTALFQDWEQEETETLAFLFVSNTVDLETIVPLAKQKVGNHTNLLTIVGGGVIGNEQEVEKEDLPSISILAGPIRNENAFVVTSSPQQQQPQTFRSKSSVFLFTDPYCTQVQNTLEHLEEQDCIVAGGVSVPSPSKSTTKSSSLAWNDEILPVGSCVGVELPEAYELHCVVSQGGCKAIGPTFTVTSVDGPAVHELNETKAIDQLQNLPQQDQQLVQQMGGSILGGTSTRKDDDYYYTRIRQVTGFRPRSGSILVCGQPQIEEGDLFRFHVRSSKEALKDWKLILERAHTERLFLSSSSPTATTTTNILCGMQVSSLARGQDFFQQPNVDLQYAKQLMPEVPIGGFFANAEIGPVGIRMGFSNDKYKAYLHGFATVVIMLCETKKTTTQNNIRKCDEEGNDTLFLDSVME